uniref:FCH domain-containing protein n=1 Tax=Timema bartmani TaxID=61472 RepID=A0A7R9F4V2_9NEOP|nr:unnamed protein product [Timema bartmani]
MGFSTNLQGRAAHEALLCRQEAELRLLTTMRGCLVNKIKCDRQYADALASVVVQGRKIEKTEDLVGSLVTQAWKNMLEEIENTAKLIKQNADMVESRSVEKLNSLYAEKRKGMKLYQEEHNRIAAQFSHVKFVYWPVVYENNVSISPLYYGFRVGGEEKKMDGRRQITEGPANAKGSPDRSVQYNQWWVDPRGDGGGRPTTDSCNIFLALSSA